MIYTHINKYEMIRAFNTYGRLKTSEGGNFTMKAVEALFEYYDEMAGECFELSQAYELDVVGICCEWTQYDNIDEVREAYDLVRDDAMDVFEYLEDNTYHIVLDDDSILVREF